MSAQSEVSITHYVSSIGIIDHTLCQLNRKYQSHIVSSIGSTVTYSRLAQSAARLSTLTTATRNWQYIHQHTVGRGQLNCDGTHAETRFVLSAKRTSPFKSEGASVQSTAGSRVVRISGSNARYTVFRGSVKSTGYPLHSPISPSLPLPCIITTVSVVISTGTADIA